MTRGNVGSLLVFDPSKIDLAPSEASKMRSAHEDAVVGIITERGGGLPHTQSAPRLCIGGSRFALEDRFPTLMQWCRADHERYRADYLTKIVVVGKSSSNTKVTEIMTPQSKMMTVPPTHSVINVMELMMKHNFRHVPVVRS